MSTLRNVNLNLIPVLHALLYHRNVTRAGEALNMSQSAVSDALGNLRHVFDDGLLVKSGRDMMLTDLARTLIPQVEDAIGGIQRLLDAPEFEPAELRRRFVIATADSVVMTIGPALATELMQQAPAASVQFIELGSSAAAQARAGVVDLFVAPTEVADNFSNMHSMPIYDEEFVCIMRDAHPLADTTLTRKAYWAATHVSYRPDHRTETTLEARMMHAEGANEFDVVRVPQFTLLPHFVEVSDCLAMLPRRVAERMQRNSNICIAKLPFRNERVSMSMFWNEIKHNDPAHQWVRTIIAKLSFD